MFVLFLGHAFRVTSDKVSPGLVRRDPKRDLSKHLAPAHLLEQELHEHIDALLVTHLDLDLVDADIQVLGAIPREEINKFLKLLELR